MAKSAAASPRLEWSFARRSDVGRRRAHNEDATYLDAAHRIMVLADGMGGYQAGEVASELAVNIIAETCREGPTTDEALARIDPDAGISVAMRLMQLAIEKANNRICEMAMGKPELAGMGTTVVAARFYGGKVGIAHVGDSRCYRFRDGSLKQLTKDHSYVQEQVERGLMTEDEAAHSHQKNLITRALGINSLARADVQEFRTQVGDIFLLCSDGLSDMVPADQIAKVLAAGDHLEAMVDELVSLENAAGGRDNISVILGRVGSPEQANAWWQRLVKPTEAAR
ncbi:MAG: Stp1/IreP family PP2C-type Ser/Thr phosphatase [Casimicrobiaceae bacterium]